MNKSGVYKIYCKSNEKAYIGSSCDVKRRMQQHKSALRSNRHINEHLQSAWNKYGENNFEFVLLENVEVPNLLEREQFWIDKFLSHQRETGFNKCEVSRPTESQLFKRAKSYIITHPDGKEENIVNLEAWERKNNIPHDALRKVALGTQNSYKNYKCRFAHQTKKDWESTLIRNERHGANPKWEYIFTCPDGSEIITKRFNDFCKEHSLNVGCMYETLLGKKGRTQHKGYKCSRRLLSKL